MKAPLPDWTQSQSKWLTDTPVEQNAEYGLEIDDFLEEVKAKGLFTIIEGDEHTLLLDLDTAHDYNMLPDRLQQVNQYFEPNDRKEYFSVSGPPKRHIILRFHSSFDNTETAIALQLFLGSDPVKEFLSLMRYKQGIHPCIFLLRPNR